MRMRDEMEAAARFVTRVSDSQDDDDASPRHRLQAVFALWLAARAGIPFAVASLERTAAAAGLALERASRCGSFDPYTYDPRLLLVCREAMRACGVECAPLAAFAGDLVAVIQDVNAIPRRLAGTIALLELLDEMPLCPKSTARVDLPPATESLLRAPAPVLHDVCNQIAASSCFGARGVPRATRTGYLSTLPMILMQKLREYDLMLGASVLRSLKYLGMRDAEELDYAREYVLCQQQADGRFGYYARELSEGATLRNPHRELYLPVTVSMLWALVEIETPGACLVRD